MVARHPLRLISKSEESAEAGMAVDDDLDKKAADLYRDAIVVDAACPLLNRDGEWPNWLDGGVTAAMATVAIHDDLAATIRHIGQWYTKIRRYADRLLHATSVSDIERAKAQRKLAVVFHFQNARPLGYDPSLVEIYHRLGVRAIQLTYNVKNPLGDGCSERTDCGLSDLGVAVIGELNRTGIVVDLSHTGFQTTMDAMEVSSAPVIFSHSNAKAICNHPRNITDDQIRALAQKDGVIGLNGYPAFVTSERRAPTLDDLLQHLDYIANLVGIDHIGLGLDYFSIDEAGYQQRLIDAVWKPDVYPPPPYHYPTGIENAARLSNLAPALLQRGYSPDDACKVLGGNFVRVFRNVWGA